MNGAPKLLLAVALAALVASLFAACGSDSADSTATAAARSSSTPEEASAAFRTPGAKNKVQNFGREAGAAERKAASAALHAYMEARARADGPAACAHLARVSVRLLSNARPSLKICAKTYAMLNKGQPSVYRANTMVDGIASLRVEGDRGFALYHGTKGIDYFSPMIREDGVWKVVGLDPNEFP